MYRVAVIGGKPAPIAGAKDLDIDVTLLHEPGKYDPREVAPHCGDIVDCSITDSGAMLAALLPRHQERPFDLVLTNTEDAAIPVGRVVEALGMPGTTERTSRVIKDKTLTRRALENGGLSPVRYRALATVDDALDFLELVGDRVVIKPADGVASLQIHVAETPEQASTAWKQLQDAGYRSVIAEEYLEGPVVSVDSFSHQGRHIVFGMSEYQMNELFVEWEVSTISDAAWGHRDELRAMTAQLLDAVGLTDGPAHSEYVLTPEGPRVLETHNRLAGSGAPELVRRATGHSLGRMFLTVPLGIDKLPDASPDPIAGAAIRFFTPPPGTITDITGITGIEQAGVPVLRLPRGERAPHIIPYLGELTEAEVAVVLTKHEGDRVSALNSVKDCDNGYVIATGSDRRAAVARCAEVIDRIRFHTS